MATTTENVEEMTYKSKKHYFRSNRTKKKKKKNTYLNFVPFHLHDLTYGGVFSSAIPPTLNFPVNSQFCGMYVFVYIISHHS